ncbi:MAG: hypothetical protein Q8P77_00230 [Candidatus Veblenbacteria bacterium]|nr:hypothetical protein [Candidatus Veblenbacteria bacterium]
MKWLSNVVLVAVLDGLIVLAGVRLATLLNNVPTVVARVSTQQESVRPARLDVVVVADGTCPTCTSTQPFLDALQKQQVVFSTIKQIDGTTEEGKRYLAEQKLERFPAVVVSGETSRSSGLEQFLTQTSTRGESQFNYAVPAPYHEVTSDKVRGIFRATYLASSNCSGCYDVTGNAGALKNLGVNVTEDKVVTAESSEGQELIQQYKIRYLPTIILVGDLGVYPGLQEVWPQVGSKEDDGTYILRDGVRLMGTYYDLQLQRAVIAQPNTSSP